MFVHRVIGFYYQVAGKIHEWIGTMIGSDVEAEAGRFDQLIGRIVADSGVSLAEAENRAKML